jgi:hypothetical protein
MARKRTLDPEVREKQMIALAMDRAEEQLREGTASAQVITHFLKLGSSREQAEREKLECENEVLRAKVDAYQSGMRTEEQYANVLEAFRRYSGASDE